MLLPANICYAAVFPVLYAGLAPDFCDVDPVTGNVTEETVRAAVTGETGAVIVPHMYGNPVKDLPAVRDLCRGNGILLIEDCASAMGAEGTGAAGDYVIYSTGYAKTVDIGFGGLLVSHSRDLKAEEAAEAALPEASPEDLAEYALMSPLYRLLRNRGMETGIARDLFRTLPEHLRGALVHRLPPEKQGAVLEAVRRLPETVQARRDGFRAYLDALRSPALKGASVVPFDPGAVPWRLNLLIEDPGRRKAFIRDCLDRGLPVSDWYPVVTPLLGRTERYPGAEAHERQILNFPLPADRETVARICGQIRRFF